MALSVIDACHWRLTFLLWSLRKTETMLSNEPAVVLVKLIETIGAYKTMDTSPEILKLQQIKFPEHSEFLEAMQSVLVLKKCRCQHWSEPGPCGQQTCIQGPISR